MDQNITSVVELPIISLQGNVQQGNLTRSYTFYLRQTQDLRIISYENKKAFQSNLNCPLADRRMGFVVNKFEHSHRLAGNRVRSLFGEVHVAQV